MLMTSVMIPVHTEAAQTQDTVVAGSEAAGFGGLQDQCHRAGERNEHRYQPGVPG